MLQSIHRGITQLVATLPFSSASEQYTVDIVGHSPSLPLARAALPASEGAGSVAWIQSFDKA